MSLKLIPSVLTLIIGMLVLPVIAKDDAAPQIKMVIESQIEAFKADDFDTAFRYASPSIQSIFQNADNFGLMVRRGYPMVWRPADVQFLDLLEIEGDMWQQVLIRDQSGEQYVVLYRMQWVRDGWRINGVQVGKTPDQLT